MWWRWIILVVCGLLVLACVISTTIDWIKGNTGPLGPKPEDWWGCGAFTIILAVIMFWVSRGLFR